MDKFKVGQWVRVVDASGAPKSYDVGEVCQVEHVGSLVRCVGKKSGMYKIRFEPWTPRVGERVRVIYGSFWNGEGEVYRNDGSVICVMMETGHNTGQKGGFRLAEIEPLPVAALAQAQPAKDERADAGGGFKAGDKIRLVKSAIKGHRKLGDVFEAVARKQTAHKDSVCYRDSTGSVTWAPGEYFELLQPIQLETGKFYKTRDGRKVGPMVKSAWAGFTDGSRSVTSQRWEADGSFISGQIGNLDLVAEWIDKPASNDNAPVAGQLAAKPKFKVGDVAIGKSGKTYTLVDNSDNEFWPLRGEGEFGLSQFFKQDGEAWVGHHNGGDTLVSVVRSTAIVALIENGKPKPAINPLVHSSAELAAKEAERLANKFKGQQFGVYVLSSTSEKVKPVYDHAWQRLAADGLKIDAIKELRGITGMGLKPAKDAVEYFLQAA